MLEAIMSFLKSGMLFELMIYAAIVLIAVVAAGRCFTPLRANTRALRRASRKIADEVKRGVDEPSWNDPRFLGARLENAWSAFLKNAQARDLHGDTCDVSDYINEETVIDANPGRELGEMVPGIMVSLGILGTFLGLVTGLSGLQLIEDTDAMLTAVQQLISGMSTAFLTSIFGVIASLIFNLLRRSATGKCEHALHKFIDTFQHYAMPKPVDDGTQLVTMQQEQNEYMRQMVEEIALRMAGQMEQSIMRAMLPVQRSMDNFIIAATREQVEGIDRIAARFVERMNKALDGEFVKLGQTLEQVRTSNQQTQDDLRAAAQSIGVLAQDVTAMHHLSQSVIEQFRAYVDDLAGQKSIVEKACLANAQAIDHLNNTMRAQIQALDELNAYRIQMENNQQTYLEELRTHETEYGAQLQKNQNEFRNQLHKSQSDYQTQLQRNQQEYLRSAEQLVGTLARQMQGTTQELERVSLKMESAAALLNSSYLAFSEQIENGLVKASAIMDESVGSTMAQMARSLESIRSAAREMTDVALKAAKTAQESAASKQQPLRAPGSIRPSGEESDKEGA